MKEKRGSAFWFKRTFFVIVIYLALTGLTWGIVISAWILSNSSYESKGLQFGTLSILVLPFILIAPVTIILLRIQKVRELVS